VADLRVPFFEYSRLFKDDRASLLAVIEDVGNRGAYILQKDVVEFEAALANYVGTKFAIGVANATDALEIAWTAVGLKLGDEVIISSHTMLATASAIIVAGGVPIPVDIGSDNLIDPAAVESAITSRTVGISPTHLNGRTCAMDEISAIAKKHKLAIVEDSAQGLGSKFDGKSAGSFSDAAAFSFYPAKILGSMGDGGAITTSDSVLYEKMYQMHDHGRDTLGQIKSWGRNSRLDNLQAAILNFKFKTYEETIKRRREIATRYNDSLGEIPALSLPEPPTENSKNFDTFQNYEITAEGRDDLVSYLKLNGVGTLIQWGGKGIHQWEHVNFVGSLPNTENFFQKCVMLPINMFVSNADIDYVCEKILEFYQQRN
jgi:dTDP-4-amino-4,6-dideoxygalactose transaminase